MGSGFFFLEGGIEAVGGDVKDAFYGRGFHFEIRFGSLGAFEEGVGAMVGGEDAAQCGDFGGAKGEEGAAAVVHIAPEADRSGSVMSQGGLFGIQQAEITVKRITAGEVVPAVVEGVKGDIVEESGCRVADDGDVFQERFDRRPEQAVERGLIFVYPSAVVTHYYPEQGVLAAQMDESGEAVGTAVNKGSIENTVVAAAGGAVPEPNETNIGSSGAGCKRAAGDVAGQVLSGQTLLEIAGSFFEAVHTKGSGIRRESILRGKELAVVDPIGIEVYECGVVGAPDPGAKTGLVDKGEVLVLPFEAAGLFENFFLNVRLTVQAGIEQVEDVGEAGGIFELVVFGETGEVLPDPFEGKAGEVEEAIGCFVIPVLVDEVGAEAGDGLLELEGIDQALAIKFGDHEPKDGVCTGILAGIGIEGAQGDEVGEVVGAFERKRVHDVEVGLAERDRFGQAVDPLVDGCFLHDGERMKIRVVVLGEEQTVFSLMHAAEGAVRPAAFQPRLGKIEKELRSLGVV